MEPLNGFTRAEPWPSGCKGRQRGAQRLKYGVSIEVWLAIPRRLFGPESVKGVSDA
jgi:hypothetical protein